MSTSVTLAVTPRRPVAPDRYFGEVAEDIAALLSAYGQPQRPGLWAPREGPVRLLFQLTGPSRVTAGQQLLEDLRRLGYEADLSVSR